MEEGTYESLIKRYGIDIESLKKEQLKLAKELVMKDKIDFSLVESFAGFCNVFIKNKILSCIIVCNKSFEIVDRAYSFETVRFPYLPEFRSYRELPAMINAFEKLNEKPDLVFVPGEGIVHPRLGLASHFSLVSGVPAIGISNVLVGCDVKGNDIIKGSKKVGSLLIEKEGSRPMYVSPGNWISVESAKKMSAKIIKLPHKRPEPLHLASKYAKEVREELN